MVYSGNFRSISCAPLLLGHHGLSGVYRPDCRPVVKDTCKTLLGPWAWSTVSRSHSAVPEWPIAADALVLVFANERAG